MPRRKEKPLTWDWRIGALRCKRRIQVPGVRSWLCGLCEHPRRCTRATCIEVSEEKKVIGVGKVEVKSTKPEEEIMAEEYRRRHLGLGLQVYANRTLLQEGRDYTFDGAIITLKCPKRGAVVCHYCEGR